MSNDIRIIRAWVCCDGSRHHSRLPVQWLLRDRTDQEKWNSDKIIKRISYRIRERLKDFSVGSWRLGIDRKGNVL